MINGAIRRIVAPLMLTAISLALLHRVAPAQTAPEAREHMLQLIDHGSLKEAVQFGEQAAKRWNSDAEIHHYLALLI